MKSSHFYMAIAALALLSALTTCITVITVARSYGLGVYAYRRATAGDDEPPKIDVNVFRAGELNATLATGAYERLMDRGVVYYQLRMADGRTDASDYSMLMQSIEMKNVANGYAGCDARGVCLNIVIGASAELAAGLGAPDGLAQLGAVDGRVPWPQMPRNTENTTNLGVTYAPLDANGTIPESFLPLKPGTAIEFISTWDPVSNTPPLSDASGEEDGHFYVCLLPAGAPSPYNFTLGANAQWDTGDGVLRFNGTWYKIGRTGGVKSVNSRVGAVDLSLRDMDGVDPALNATPGNLLRGDGTAWRSVTPSAIRPYLVATWSSDLWYMTNIEFFEQIKFMDQWIITEVGGEFLNVHSASPFTKVQYISIPSSGWYYVSTFATHRMRKDDGQSVFTLVSSGGNRFPLQPFLPGILDQRRYRDNPDCDYGENSLCRNTMSIRRVVYLNGGYTLRTGVFFESTCCITEVWDYIGMTNVGGPATGLFIMKLY